MNARPADAGANRGLRARMGGQMDLKTEEEIEDLEVEIEEEDDPDDEDWEDDEEED